MKRVYYGLLLLLILIGFGSIVQRFIEGMSVTNLTSYSSWGLWVVFYIFFIGLSAGSFLLSTMIYVFKMDSLEKVGRIALSTAFFSLVGGLLFIFIDLGHPERFWHTLVYRNMSSVLTWEIHFYLAYIVVVLGELWLVLREDLSSLTANYTGFKQKIVNILSLGYRTPENEEERNRKTESAKRWVKILGIIGIPLALGVHGGTGSIFAVLMAKPHWNSSIIPVIFIVSALVSGTALVTFIYALFGRNDSVKSGVLNSLSSLLIMFIVLDLLLVFSEFLIGLYSGIPGVAHSLQEVMVGSYGTIFWIGQIGLGAVVPILLIVWSNKNNSYALKGLAGISTVIGIIAVRTNLVLPAYSETQIPGIDKAYIDPRLTLQYFPSSIEILSTIGIIAFLVFLFSVTWEVLPIRDHEQAEYKFTEGRNLNYGTEKSTIQA